MCILLLKNRRRYRKRLRYDVKINHLTPALSLKEREGNRTVPSLIREGKGG